ncbi:hypothetical protein GA0070607_4080 [Micromonospora coriariae]|uniref:Uncharacterized protein n=1 Tax=Micromonospora coriariae TaxID=285665 RepID=A0A1C4WSM6_9ACTN|nr:hypothetical protein GA0070607_4080 [Micromonospora coriariae]
MASLLGLALMGCQLPLPSIRERCEQVRSPSGDRLDLSAGCAHNFATASPNFFACDGFTFPVSRTRIRLSVGR